MSRLYILEQKIATLEIIIESLVEELIDSEIVDRDGLDKKILDRIKELGNQVKEQEIEVELLNFPYWGEKGEA
jgi:uncharacterized coiled-coil protein SlyX